MKIYLFFLSLFFPIIKSYVFLTIDLLCDDVCLDILIDEISIKDETNLETKRHYYLHQIKFIAEPNQITFSTFNDKGISGMALRITIKSNTNIYFIIQHQMKIYFHVI